MSDKQQIIIQDVGGYHNNNDQKTRDRLIRGNTYKDLSTICIVPTRGMIHAKVVQSWMNLMTPMNQKFLRMFVIGMEVGEAYSTAIEQILAHPDLSKWKYIFTLEEDNVPPPDGLLKLYECMDKFDVAGGLYWTKGEGGQAMVYGNPQIMPRNFIPQIPIPDTKMHCNGLGMGFNLFKLDIFKDPKLPKPFFKTVQEYKQGVGVKGYSQDLYFYENAGNLGYKFACCTSCTVGHLDPATGFVW